MPLLLHHKRLRLDRDDFSARFRHNLVLRQFGLWLIHWPGCLCSNEPPLCHNQNPHIYRYLLVLFLYQWVECLLFGTSCVYRHPTLYRGKQPQVPSRKASQGGIRRVLFVVSATATRCPLVRLSLTCLASHESVVLRFPTRAVTRHRAFSFCAVRQSVPTLEGRA